MRIANFTFALGSLDKIHYLYFLVVQFWLPVKPHVHPIFLPRFTNFIRPFFHFQKKKYLTKKAHFGLYKRIGNYFKYLWSNTSSSSILYELNFQFKNHYATSEARPFSNNCSSFTMKPTGMCFITFRRLHSKHIFNQIRHICLAWHTSTLRG